MQNNLLTYILTYH